MLASLTTPVHTRLVPAPVSIMPITLTTTGTTTGTDTGTITVMAGTEKRTTRVWESTRS